ncbi:bifunctional folylpolyglutamate synthase/dihydrofolate synthase [Azospirillum halopraeferens]|uniref:bifunctional folylpolyglutamate synthase/dihydrofolate synthase n=1 Tax=Azospirillum halopraeferens TaxID=34010 RepID=UPI0004262664|nr:Mur ligase family protein [Azospirillum halopraeferens]
MRAPDPAGGLAAAALDRFRGRLPRAIDLTLGRVHRLLGRLGDPHRRLAPVIHVAGTNGKGSTVAFLRAMLEAAGLRVHAFTSPHLVTIHECVRLAAPGGGRLVEDAVLADALERCDRASADDPVTVFEALTCAAFLLFAETPADVVLVEVGMGGTEDATNVFDAPAVSVITRISRDHAEYLGDTVEVIARAKAGIVKAGRPIILAPQADPAAAAVVAGTAARLGAPLHAAGADWSVETIPGGFRYRGARGVLDLPPPSLTGAHQMVNAATAVAALDALSGEGPRIPDAAVREGVRTARWPARLQRLTGSSLADALPPGSDLWLDGGHNDSAGEALGVQAAAWAADGLPLGLVVAMLAVKDADAFLAPLASRVTALRAVPLLGALPGGARGMAPERLAGAARAAGIADAAVAAGVHSAVAELGARLGRPCRVLICGSLYQAGAVLATVRPGSG